MNKKEWRVQMRKQLSEQALSSDVLNAINQHLAHFLRNQPDESIWSSYQSLPDEVPLTIDTKIVKMTWCWPEWESGNPKPMTFRGLGSETISVDDLDGCLVPGLAFDPTNGIRLGRGGGAFDRTFQAKKTNKKLIKMGVCRSMQLIQGLPYDHWDIPMDLILTEKGIVSWKSL